MSDNRIDFQAALKQTVVPRIGSMGYQKIVLPEWKGAPITFFRKHLFDAIFGYIQFQLGRWAATPPDVPPIPRSFTIILIRNAGDKPDPIPREYRYYLTMTLSDLLWVVVGIHKYQGQSHQWEYFTRDELSDQLQMAADDLVSFGIPWLEDPKSKNPLLKRH